MGAVSPVSKAWSWKEGRGWLCNFMDTGTARGGGLLGLTALSALRDLARHHLSPLSNWLRCLSTLPFPSVLRYLRWLFCLNLQLLSFEELRDAAAAAARNLKATS